MKDDEKKINISIYGLLYLVECDKHSSLAEHTELDIRNVMEPAAQNTMSYFISF